MKFAAGTVSVTVLVSVPDGVQRVRVRYSDDYWIRYGGVEDARWEEGSTADTPQEFYQKLEL